MHLSQINLVVAIANELTRQGVGEVETRCFNAVLSAANDIVAEFEKPRRPAVPGMGLAAWLQCDDVGQSSKYMAKCLSEGGWAADPAYPLDAGDFGRCVKMLEALKCERSDVKKMRDKGPVWEELVNNWLLLEKQWREGEYGAVSKSIAEIRKRCE
jgi:hypothetical protein